MVRAILEGRKTQTRRVLKYQPASVEGPNFDGLWSFTRDPVTTLFACPYGQPGDRLWVRETFQLHESWNAFPPSKVTNRGFVYYTADDKTNPEAKIRPSIHMPRALSRITLEIESVRVERLQDISGSDCVSEGVELKRWKTGEYPEIDPGLEGDNRDLRWLYKRLWDSLNANRGHGWEANPWVWVVQFKVIC